MPNPSKTVYPHQLYVPLYDNPRAEATRIQMEAHWAEHRELEAFANLHGFTPSRRVISLNGHLKAEQIPWLQRKWNEFRQLQQFAMKKGFVPSMGFSNVSMPTLDGRAVIEAEVTAKPQPSSSVKKTGRVVDGNIAKPTAPRVPNVAPDTSVIEAGIQRAKERIAKAGAEHEAAAEQCELAYHIFQRAENVLKQTWDKDRAHAFVEQVDHMNEIAKAQEDVERKKKAWKKAEKKKIVAAAAEEQVKNWLAELIGGHSFP